MVGIALSLTDATTFGTAFAYRVFVQDVRHADCNHLKEHRDHCEQIREEPRAHVLVRDGLVHKAHAAKHSSEIIR